MNVLPLDADPLSVPGFYVWTTEPTPYGVSFLLLRQPEQEWQPIGEFLVAEVQFPRVMSWRTPAMEDLVPTTRLRHYDRINARMTHVIGEVTVLAAEFMESLVDESVAELIAQAKEAEERREKERVAAREAAEKDRAERMEKERVRGELLQKRQVHLYEIMKWRIGDYMKCRRDGYRQTSYPQGTIDRVDARGMDITTEKRKPMRIEWRDVNRLLIKIPDTRKYDNVYEAGEESEVNLDEHRNSV